MSSHPSPGPSTQTISSRHRQKPHTVGIAAGAEDAKYQAKYKDLKRKVKEIETDNDKLHFKVLQAKRSIQRMKLERAILYERLSGTGPPLSDIQERHVIPPPIHLGPGVPPLPPSRSHSGSYHNQEPADLHPPQDIPGYHIGYDRNYVPRNEGPPVNTMAIGPGMAPPTHMSGVHSPPRRNSGGPGHDSIRHSQQLPPLPPAPHMEGNHNHNHSRSHASPTIHHSHSGSSHERTRSHSSSRSRARHESTQPYLPGHTHPQQYPEGLPSVQQVLHSPPLSARETRERQRRQPVRTDSHKHGRLASFMPRLSPPLVQAEARSSRVHSHQRIGPGSYINRDDHYERQRDLDREREREWEREREQRDRERDRERSRDLGGGRDANSSHMVSPPMVPRRSRPLVDRDYQEHHVSSRMHEEQYYRDPPPGPAGYPMISHSGSPGSGSGSGSGNGAGEAPSRPESRTHYYEQPERTRSSSYRLRPVNQPNEDLDFVHEDGRSMSSRDRGSGGGGGTFPPPEQSRSSVESRKRARNDMDVDSDDAGDGPVYSGGRMSEDRGSKRYHREPRRSVDNQEDGRMGPP
ncbi:hypothetical protein Hypma_012795 [Hypsizygus marmoreus]|uniref:INO80 complex subunit F domain-containing protein n=1 Tax=Hypsizygus marmoreus TaxID=39966 RepID=A0A369JFD7_HYPMA|nr:hypothetical protein Hypma_012795 [Hypsizygus marmoreus]